MLTKEEIIQYHKNATAAFKQDGNPSYEMDGINMFLQLKNFGIGDMPETVEQLTEEQAARICQMAFAFKTLVG